jgi:hypothetical protein
MSISIMNGKEFMLTTSAPNKLPHLNHFQQKRKYGCAGADPK